MDDEPYVADDNELRHTRLVMSWEGGKAKLYKIFRKLDRFDSIKQEKDNGKTLSIQLEKSSIYIVFEWLLQRYMYIPNYM